MLVNSLSAAILVVFLWAVWLLMRKCSRQDAVLAGLALFAVLLAAVQFGTGYSFASVLAPLIVYGIACVAYGAIFIVVWRKNRLTSVLGLAAGIAGLVLIAPDILPVAPLVMGTSKIFPAAEGRVTPTTTYRIFLRHSLWGATPYYGYIIYTNPHWFPVIEKEVARGASPCGNDDGLNDTVVSRGPDDQTIQISCRGGVPEVRPIEVKLR